MNSNLKLFITDFLYSEYAGIMLQMKLRASASLLAHKLPPSPKIINNLNNEVCSWEDGIRRLRYIHLNSTSNTFSYQWDVQEQWRHPEINKITQSLQRKTENSQDGFDVPCSFSLYIPHLQHCLLGWIPLCHPSIIMKYVGLIIVT